MKADPYRGRKAVSLKGKTVVGRHDRLAFAFRSQLGAAVVEKASPK